MQKRTPIWLAIGLLLLSCPWSFSQNERSDIPEQLQPDTATNSILAFLNDPSTQKLRGEQLEQTLKARFDIRSALVREANNERVIKLLVEGSQKVIAFDRGNRQGVSVYGRAIILKGDGQRWNKVTDEFVLDLGD